MSDKKAHILIVDDELGPRESLRMILKDDFSLAFATNGKEAVEHIQQKGADLVIMDMKMPEMDGIEALKKIKEICPYISVLMVTGYGTVDTAVESMKIGANDFISKPFDSHYLRNAVENAINRRKQQMDTEKMIHDLREMSDRLLKRQEDLQSEILELSKLSTVGMLAQGMAHNLSSPLLIILGRAELMREKLINLRKQMESLLKEQNNKDLQLLVKEYDNNIQNTEIIIENVSKLTEIIRTIMNKSRQDHNIELQMINISQLLREEIKFLDADLFFKHHIEKQYDLSDSLPLLSGVYSDFSQSFLNIIKNAIDAMHSSPIKKLTVRSFHDEKAIYVEITDTGCGIREEDQPKIFEPYFTTKPMINKGKGPYGTGLGLHMANLLLKPYNAKIEFSSSPHGTTFVVSIPYRESR